MSKPRNYPKIISRTPTDPQVKPIRSWFPANRGFYARFREWLVETGYGLSALSIYGSAARQALGWLDKPYWTLDPDADLARARAYFAALITSPGTWQGYQKGLAKLETYLRLTCHHPPKEKTVNWAYYLSPLPAEIAAEVGRFVRFCMQRWPPERRVRKATTFLSSLTLPLRWLAARDQLETIPDLTPEAWYRYLDARLQEGLKPNTLNIHLSALQTWLEFLQEEGREICARMLRVNVLDESARLPKDAPLSQVRTLLNAVRTAAEASHRLVRRMGRMDHAWVLLMLHCGLRTCEIRALKLTAIHWEAKKLRIEQSKGMRDRFVFLSAPAISALKSYLEVRGPEEALPPEVFIYRHQALSPSYCYERLRTYGQRCGVKITPHQLRHTAATLLLNAGAPVLTVQAILGHKYVDTTLGYARLYDGTVAADYYRAMQTIERQTALSDEAPKKPPNLGELVALADALRRGTLGVEQLETLGALRAGLVALAETEFR